MRQNQRGRDSDLRDGGLHDGASGARPTKQMFATALAATTAAGIMALALASALALATAGCGKSSNSEVTLDGGTGGGGANDGGGTAGAPGGGAGGTTGSGAGGQTTGSGGTTGGGGVATGTGGARATGGTTGAAGAPGGGAGGSGASCPALAGYSQAEHIIMNVTWPSTLGTMGGTGQVHVWAKTTFTASGNNLMATSQACGSVLPPTGLNAIAGGGSVLIQIPDATWDLPSMPRFMFSATQTGWGVGSTITYTSTALVGLTLTDPTNGAWPATITTGVDADGDMKPGYTALPATTAGHVLPPTGLITTSRADQVDIATRNVFMVTATRTACDHAAGPITVTHFDSHVVGCHVMGGTDCTTNQSDFVDQNRTIYAAGSSTIELKVVPAAATCADVRAALPMM